MKKRLILIMAFILLLLFAGCNSEKQTDPAAIASVNGDIITQSDFDTHYRLIKNDYETKQDIVLDETKDADTIDKLKSTTYDDLIMQKLTRQDAEKRGITVDSAEVDSVLESFKQARNSAEADGYQKFLDRVGVTEQDIRDQIEISKLYDQLIDQVVGGMTVSDADALKYYNENPSQFNDPGGIEIYHILVDSEQMANEILAKLKQGQDFAELAQQYSSDSGSKDNGGDVGTVNEDTNFVPEFKKVALSLQPGQLYPEPVKTQYGYHIIKAGDRKAAVQTPFAQVKDRIKQSLGQSQKEQAFRTYLDQLKSSADIQDLRQQ